MTRGSGKSQHKKKNDSLHERSRELIYKDVDQEYAIVNKHFGDGRFECTIIGSSRVVRGNIRGKLRNKVYINSGDYILMSKRDWNDDVFDILHKYSHNEVNQLKISGEIEENQNSDDDIFIGINLEKM